MCTSSLMAIGTPLSGSPWPRRVSAASASASALSRSTTRYALRTGCRRWIRLRNSSVSSRELQHRSIIQFNLASGSMLGLEVQAITGELWAFAQAELDETRRIVEKIAALGGDPTPKVAKV